jgi:hypothetical protein
MINIIPRTKVGALMLFTLFGEIACTSPDWGTRSQSISASEFISSGCISIYRSRLSLYYLTNENKENIWVSVNKDSEAMDSLMKFFSYDPNTVKNVSTIRMKGDDTIFCVRIESMNIGEEVYVQDCFLFYNEPNFDSPRIERLELCSERGHF